MQVYARLVGGHKAGVTKLQVLGSKEENGHDLLLSAGADGSVAVWEPSSAAPAGPDKERLPKVAQPPVDTSIGEACVSHCSTRG